MKIIAGVDGGATQTRVALADTSGRILGTGKSGPSNYGSVPKYKIQNHIEEAFRQAFEQAEISITQIEAIFLGMAGVVSKADRKAIRQIIEESELVNVREICVDHDIRISLGGGLAGQEGIALIVGTGSSCYGSSRGGRDWMAGGWGHLLDDRGSAYDIARRGLSAVIRAADGRGPKTDLTEVIMQGLNISQIHEIMQKVYVDGPSGRPMDKKEIASLATLVTKAAHEGDEVALQIVREGISELVLMVKTVVNHLNFSSSRIPLVISGGTVNGSTLIKNKLFGALQSSGLEIAIQKPIFSPVKGSILLALQRIGIDIEEEIIANMKESAYSEA